MDKIIPNVTKIDANESHLSAAVSSASPGIQVLEKQHFRAEVSLHHMQVHSFKYQSDQSIFIYEIPIICFSVFFK